MMHCEPEMIEKHIEMIHVMDKRIDKLITLQEVTTDNINELTSDIKHTMCNKNECDSMFKKIRLLDDEVTSLVDKTSEFIKGTTLIGLFVVIIGYSISFGVYTTSNIHRLDITTTELKDSVK